MNNLKIGSFVNHQTFGDGVVYKVTPLIASVVFFKDGSKHDILDSFLDEPISNHNLDDLIKVKALSAFYDQKTTKKANEYVNTSNIRTISFSPDRMSVSAIVLGTSSYNVTFEVFKNRLMISCDCPVSGLCKHEAALALFLEKNPGVSDSESTKEIEYTKEGRELLPLFNKTDELNIETLSNIKKLLSVLRTLEPFEIVNLLNQFPLNYEEYPYHVRALASNDIIASRLGEYGLTNLDEPLLNIFSLHKTFQPTYFEMKRDSIVNPSISDKVNLYHLFNLNYYSLATSLVTGKKTDLTKLIASFGVTDLLPYMHKTPFLNLFGGDKLELRKIYESIEDKDKKLEFYFKFEKELMQSGVINDSFSVKDRLLYLTNIKDKNAKLNSLELIAPYALKEGLYLEVSEAVLSFLHDQDYRLTYREITVLVNIVHGCKDLKILEKIIKGEMIYD